ncbi:hypothetical protein GCM10010420_05690 [Streptomyces glaucosporus]|uniref:Secreted protein n=1 Tax=Streptomyces glaucosporus TaxID=284044 RepID=A0ABN3HRA2_9ACTN
MMCTGLLLSDMGMTIEPSPAPPPAPCRPGTAAAGAAVRLPVRRGTPGAGDTRGTAALRCRDMRRDGGGQSAGADAPPAPAVPPEPFARRGTLRPEAACPAAGPTRERSR